MRLRRIALAALVIALLVPPLTAPAAAAPPNSATIAGTTDFEIVESAPIETSLDHPDIRNAPEVWIEMIRGARRTLDFAEFYASSKEGSALDLVIAEIERAAKRGVEVRFLYEGRMNASRKETLERLARIGRRAEIRTIDFRAIAGGVHHAKYFLVDGTDSETAQVYLGSQNFDWRSLEHIQELGVRIRDEGFARVLRDVYEADWAMAGAERDSAPLVRPEPPDANGRFVAGIEAGIEEGRIIFWPVASPTGWIPDENLWDEPRLAAMIDNARSDVSVQLLTYKPVSDSVYWDPLESALRRAAARGVRVRLIVSDWCKRRSTIPYLKSLTLVPNVEVRMMTIPEWSGGFIPYARVIHAKYMVVDGRSSWIGTSNWERDYFHASRNVGVIAESARIGGILARFFDGNWTSSYAYAVRPEEDYKPPRIGE